MKVFRFTWPYLSKLKGKFWVYALLNMILWLLSLLTPYSVGNYVDNLLRYNEKRVIWNTVSVLGIFWTLQLITSYVKNIISTQLYSLVCHDIKVSLLKHLIKLPLGFFKKYNAAYLTQRISTDAQVMTSYAVSDSLSLIEIVISFVFVGVILFLLNKTLLLMICLLLPIYLLIHIAFQKSLYTSRKEFTEANAMHFSATERILSNIKSVKMHELQARLLDEINTTFEDLYGKAVKNARIGYIVNNADAIARYFANIAVFVYAGYQILDNKMSIGQFTMINSYSSMLFAYMSAALRIGKNYRDVCVAYDRAIQFLNEPEEQCGEKCLEQVTSIEAKNVYFSYDEQNVINNLSFRLNRGNIYLLTGENGAGKSTLINILCGLEQNYEGEIYIDEIDLRHLNHRYMREHFLSIVEQEPVLFFQKLRENILDVKDDLSDIFWLMENLRLTEFLTAFMPESDESISVDIQNLSGGEKQKFAIVRALIKNADVIVLDEPTSALDEESSKQLCKILMSLKDSKIIVVVSHSKDVIEIGDAIVTL